jgi:sugar phosphate isomerase/epimerase
MKVGVQTFLGPDIKEKFKLMREMGFDNCQMTNWNASLHTDEMAALVNEACEEYGITITAHWVGWSGPSAWNFTEGPTTLGIVPREWREQRVKELKLGADFAKKIGVTDVITHAGFLPECPTDPTYPEILDCLKDLCQYMKDQGQYFLFETGQETPTTLLRFIENIGTGNVGINLDSANLILYGKANPIDALDVIGKYVRGIHAKDGFYPTNGKELGREVKVGDGMANIPEVIKRLKAVNYTGNYIIEREISGDQQTKDIKETLEYLKKILSEN